MGMGGRKRATWIALGPFDAKKMIVGSKIKNADVYSTAKGTTLLILPKRGSNRALILWRLRSGYRGRAKIIPDDDAACVAYDTSWHSGALGETAECLCILSPWQGMDAEICGEGGEATDIRLEWTGRIVLVREESNSGLKEA